MAYPNKRPTVDGIVSRRSEYIRPLDGYSDNSGSITFIVPGSPTEFLSSAFTIHMSFAVVLNTGRLFEEMGFINYLKLKVTFRLQLM